MEYSLDEDALGQQLAAQGLDQARYRLIIDTLVQAGLVSRVGNRLKAADWIEDDPERAVRSLNATKGGQP
jgi:hypothetical protein